PFVPTKQPTVPDVVVQATFATQGQAIEARAEQVVSDRIGVRTHRPSPAARRLRRISRNRWRRALPYERTPSRAGDTAANSRIARVPARGGHHLGNRHRPQAGVISGLIDRGTAIIALVHRRSARSAVRVIGTFAVIHEPATLAV